MKKMLFLIMLVSVTSAFGVVWEDNPEYTPEQREQAKATNERIRNNNKEREAEKEKQIMEVAAKYFYSMKKAQKRLKDNPEYQKESMVAAMEFGRAMKSLITNPDAKIEEYINILNKLNKDYQENPIEYAENAKKIEKEINNLYFYIVERNPESQKGIEHLNLDYFLPVLAKYDSEMKKYLDEVNAIKAKYPRLLG